MLRTMSWLGDNVTRYREPSSNEQFVEDIARLHSLSVIKHEDKMHLCKGRALFAPDHNEVFMEVYTNRGENTKFIAISEIDNSFPEIGYYNVTKCGPRKAIMINRRTDSRSWRYGYHSEIADISTPYIIRGTDLMEEIFSDVPRAYEIGTRRDIDYYIHSTGKFHSFSVALASIQRGKSFSVAISRQVAIASSPYRDEVGLFLMGSKVATVGSGGEIHMVAEWAADTIMEVCND